MSGLNKSATSQTLRLPRLTRRWVVISIAALLLVIAIGLLAGFSTQIAAQVRTLRQFSNQVALADSRFCLCNPGEDISISTSDGSVIAASLYGAEEGVRKPGILMIHGNTPEGRNLPVYRVLASKLADRGYVTLTMDMTGFGESTDSFVGDTRRTMDDDAYQALDYFKGLRYLDASRLYIFGHSKGGAPALSAGIADDDVEGIIALGPPREISTLMQDPAQRDYFYTRSRDTRKLIYDKDVPASFTQEIWLEEKLQEDMDLHLGYFQTEGHKPVLLMDNELESDAAKQYLRDYYNDISEPKAYVTVPDSDHYDNTARAFGLSFYDKEAINFTVETIDGWIREQN